MGALSFAYPREYILLCLIGGLVYGFIMYSRNMPWPTWVNRGLLVLRTVIATMLLILLLAPVLRQILNTTEPPHLILAIDNSLSIKAMYDSIQLVQINRDISKLQKAFESQGYQVSLASEDALTEDFTTYTFELGQTNLDALLQDIRNDFEGRSVPEVILLSDGIINNGVLPTYRNYPFRITTVGLGDSTPKYDISIEELTYNKIAYQGNQFLLRARVIQSGFENSTIPVAVYHQGKVVDNQQVTFGNERMKEVDFILEANTNGVQRYRVSIPVQSNEFVEENNRADAYIEIIEGRQKIVILAASPHPDVSAISEVLEKNPNYEIAQYILSIPEERSKFMDYAEPTDLFILHQLPSAQQLIAWNERFADQSLLLLYGPQMDLPGLIELFPAMQAETYPGEFDKVSGILNPGYAPFSYSDDLQAMLLEFPPVITPFGDFSIQAGADVLLTQRVGSISTSKPLLITREDETTKAGVFLGSGLWQWKLTDYARNKDNRLFEEFITNLVQYLSTRADKRKFRFYPIRREYNRGEEVVFQSELYNELYERVFGNKVDIRLIRDQEELTYTYVTNKDNSRYIVSGLAEGIYQYIATTEVNGSQETIRGEFVVKDMAIETIRLTANFNMLRELSERNGGSFYTYDDIDDLIQTFVEKEVQGTLYSQEKYLPAINLLWIFILLLLLITCEWGVRKYYGSY